MADEMGVIWSAPVRPPIRRVCVLVLIALGQDWGQIHADEAADLPELFPGQGITRCDVTERPATATDVSLAKRTPVLAEPGNWLDVPGPHGERARGWQGRQPGYRIFDGRGRLLHSVPHVSMPRWSPDGRWLAVSRWSSRERPYELGLVKVSTGEVISIPNVEYLDVCAWSPDSRKLSFIGRSGDSLAAGWLSVPDTAVHVVARGLNFAFECLEMAWSADSRHFVAILHREYEHDDVRVTDLWLFGLKPGVCRLTATPTVEESNVGWLDSRHVIFSVDPTEDEPGSVGSRTVLELPRLGGSTH